ncbi:hypothetical protein [Halovivax limisalsi]|uniref:hypothetical protein n=1 Tax=Halovivax limisalsi TaxID=1453760 RepID=UPI001FFCD20A|nr:hypothetical protein [Halovivax limisalsi]
MSAPSTEHVDGSTNRSRTTAARLRSAIERRARDGSLAILAGGVAFGAALRRVRRNAGRATPLALSAVALLGLGARQRRRECADADVETGADAPRDEHGDKRVSDEAYAESHRDLGAGRTADESASADQSEAAPNPRGMSDRADVEAEEPGDIDFVADADDDAGDRRTHLEDETAHDPRLHPDADDQPTEIDLSSAAMADEASEATGPHPEQAYPAQEGTDPEPSAANAPERTGEGAVAPAGADDEAPAGDGTADERATDAPDDDGEETVVGADAGGEEPESSSGENGNADGDSPGDA